MSEVKQKVGEFKVVIGEEGAVFVYFQGGALQNKMFLRNNNDEDNAALSTLLQQDPNAPIEIYIDVLDQSYLQRVLPGVDSLSIKSLAKRRLAKETPPSHLQFALQVERIKTGRRDWVYTFISAAYEPPISTWITYLMPFDNIISGIYFLPVEAGAILKAIRESSHEGLHNKISTNPSFATNWLKGIAPIFSRLKSVILRNSTTAQKQHWDILLLNNKSGGIRQVVYQNGKVIFTRLLNNVMDPNPDVIAGNVEQELNNSVEYLRRLSLQSNDEVAVNMVLAEDIKKNIRVEKINAQSVVMFTPYELVSLLGLQGNVAKEQDRFAEPVVLSVLNQERGRIACLYTNEIRTAYFVYHGLQYFIKTIRFAIPLAVAFSIFSIYDSYQLSEKIQSNSSKRAGLLYEIDRYKTLKNNEEAKFGDKVNVEQIQEIVGVYKKLGKYSINPISLITEVASIDPASIRIRNFTWRYSTPGFAYNKPSAEAIAQGADGGAANKDAPGDTDTIINIKASVLFSNRQGGAYEDLVDKYNSFGNALATRMPEYQVKMAPLPTNLSLEKIPDEVVVDVNLDKIHQNNGTKG